ncbi:hypothetical protein N2W54_007309 [Lotmaria passim]
MSRILSPDLFRSFCLVAVAFELPVMLQLVRGELQLPDAGSWFDKEAHYTKNIALTYVFVAFLAVLVVGRGMAFFLPNLRIIIAYNIVLHSTEFLLFLYCFLHKHDESNVSAYVIGALMVGNVFTFTKQLFHLRGQQRAAEMEELKRRQEQLAIIREKRAAYAKEKKEKKEN